MNVASLPYTLLILLVELAAGSFAFVAVFDGRGQVTRGYVKTSAVVIVSTALLALWTYSALGTEREIDGYTLDRGWLPAAGWSLALLTALALSHLAALFREQRRATLLFASAGSAAGVAALATIAAVIAGPTWSYSGALASMLIAALALGGAVVAMTWGHWYLTNSGLPKEPMEQMALAVLVALVAQGVFVLAGAVLPVRQAPLTDAAFGITLGRNPAFCCASASGWPSRSCWRCWHGEPPRCAA